MDEKEIVKKQYKLFRITGTIISVPVGIAVIIYFLLDDLFIGVAITSIPIIIWVIIFINWSKKVSKKFFDGRTGITKEDIYNL
jgi:hypothetical protein